MDVLKQLDIGLSMFELNFGKKSRGNRYQTFLRPFLEPIYRCAVDQTGKHPQSHSEGLANRTEANYQFQLVLYPLQEKLEYAIQTDLP